MHCEYILRKVQLICLFSLAYEQKLACPEVQDARAYFSFVVFI